MSNARALRLNPSDNVVIVLKEVVPGTAIQGTALTARETIPAGHKVATEFIDQGASVLKYSQKIGVAMRPIEPGEHVHDHNLTRGRAAETEGIGHASKPTVFVPMAERDTFLGIVRPDGRVATRNYIGVLSTVNCSAAVTRLIADECRPYLADYPDVDGVVALCHGFGCEGPDVTGFEALQRTLTGFVRHPNFAGVLVVGLGCEGTDVDLVLEHAQLEPGPMLHTLRIQEQGGTRATVDQGVERVSEMMATAERCERRKVPASHLTVGLHCGGSDAYSGVTANPALGVAADLVVRNGGTAILSETPEICGAEHLLTRRATTREVGDKLVALTRWWYDYADSVGMNLDDNLSAGNRAGGLSNIWEKALGAVAKAGSTDLMQVYRYAEVVDESGLVFMDTPGYDPVAVTGLVAGGANMICFTTGRGSVSGCKPAPCVKLASNSVMYKRLADDMDINCGVVLDGDATVEEVGNHIFQKILATASGEKTNSEQLGVGDDEFMPWPLVPVL